jgi:hypothetical protein
MRTLLEAVAVLVPGFATAAHAERHVVVNGHRLSNRDIRSLERARSGPIPNGHYWLRGDGVWGFAGDPRPRGRIGGNRYVPERRPSLSERGPLFGPQGWLRWAHRTGPDGRDEPQAAGLGPASTTTDGSRAANLLA